jgi:hypothetical protein
MTTRTEPIVPRAGMRIRLRRGEIRDARRPMTPDNLEPYGLWIAGEVPVGTVGTVYRPRDKSGNWAVRWDGIEPKPGYYFALLRQIDPTKYEVVADQPGTEGEPNEASNERPPELTR